MLRIAIGESGQAIVFSQNVLNRFSQFQQNRRWRREAGGQLFGSVRAQEVVVEEATGPRASDRRSRFFYIPNRQREQREIDERFRMGLHFLGDWHTHPETHAHPSGEDLSSMRDCVRKSRHSLLAFLLVIVGTAPVPEGLHISLHSGSDVLTLYSREHRYA